MSRTLIAETINKIGHEVIVSGYVVAVRDHGKLVFFDLQDRTDLIQIVGSEEARGLRSQDVVLIEGKIEKRPTELVNEKILTGKIEIKAAKIKVLAKTAELPFDLSLPEPNISLPTLLDYRALTLRHPKIKAIFKVQEVIIDAFRQTLKDLGFTEFQAPIIIPSTSEGGAEVFPVKYFEHTAYLAQSPQLYKQIMLGVFEKVFTVTHAFRAEPSVTTRHLTEYISLDVEMAFIESWQEVMEVAEILIKKILTAVANFCPEELAMYNARLPATPNKFPRLKLKEAQEIIYQQFKRDVRGEPDLAPIDEEEICQWAKEKFGSDFIFISHYPVKKRPFYTFPDPDDPDYTLSFDLLGQGLEWITGGQRINNYDQLMANIKKWGNDPADFELYLQAFRYGMPPEGGFALGAERMTAKILGLANIREASLFPRDMERIDQRLSKKVKNEKKRKGDSK